MDELDRPTEGKYRLNAEGEPVKCKTLREWAENVEARGKESKRIVKQERVGAFEVSTVFMFLDHNFSREGPPILWETMVFADAPNHVRHHDSDRCGGGREQAEAMHARMVTELRAYLAQTKARK